MTIDASLDTLALPALPTYNNEFGTKKRDGGLTTAECVDGVMVWGRRQRPFPVTEDSDTTKVDANSTFEVLTAGVTLTIADATFNGCEVKVINASDGEITVKGGVSGLNGSADSVTIPARAMLFLTFFEGWITSNSTYSGSDEVSDFEKRIFLASHPPTTLYWTSNPKNPGEIYGGTWKQIKDRFVLAAGDTYTNGATGGNADTTLTNDNLPSHTHGLNGHTHSFTPSGTVASHSHTMSHTHSRGTMNITGTIGVQGPDAYPNVATGAFNTLNTGKVDGDISGESNYLNRAGFDASRSWTGETSQPSSSNTASTAPAFTGTAGTTGGATGDTAPTGEGASFSNMPPYVVKYCWERIA